MRKMFGNFAPTNIERTPSFTPLSTPAHALTQAGKLCEERLRALVIKTSMLTHTHTLKGLNMRVQQHKVLENTLGTIYGRWNICGIGYGYVQMANEHEHEQAALANFGQTCVICPRSMQNKIKRTKLLRKKLTGQQQFDFVLSCHAPRPHYYLPAWLSVCLPVRLALTNSFHLPWPIVKKKKK